MADSSSETNVPVGDWTTGTLKIYHDDKIQAAEEIAAAEFRRVDGNIEKLNVLLDERSVSQEKAVIAALTAAQEAVDKSEKSTEKRFDSVNEFRRTLANQTNTFMPRQEADQRFTAVSEKLTELTDRLNRSEGQKQGGDLTIGKVYGAVGAAVGIIGLLVLLANRIL